MVYSSVTVCLTVTFLYARYYRAFLFYTCEKQNNLRSLAAQAVTEQVVEQDNH